MKWTMDGGLRGVSVGLGALAMGGVLLGAAPASSGDGARAESAAESMTPVTGVAGSTMCVPLGPGEYYAIPLVTTKNVPGTGAARGEATAIFANSPFGISVTPDGSYLQRIRISMERLKRPRSGTYVVWFTTTEVDQIQLAGELTDFGSFEADVGWNKYLVVITHEASFDPEATMWSGPIAFRGMSRSGMMHTMAGHGPFEEEKCAAYGY